MHKRHYAEFLDAMKAGNYEQTEAGLLVRGAALARGVYTTYIDGKQVGRYPNLVPLEGRNYFLETGLNKVSPATNFYLAIFSGAVTPADNWTAANFASNATEITSATEGYSNSARPEWLAGAVASALADNTGNLASYNIVCSTSINISGAALLTSDVKGGTSGVLISATRFGTAHTVNNGSTFQLGYELELTDS